MELRLPHADNLDSVAERGYIAEERKLDTILENWINHKVIERIVDAHKELRRSQKECSVGIKPPQEAYTWDNVKGPLFYKRLNEILNPLGYSATQSHDGGGMYEVTYITWRVKPNADNGKLPGTSFRLRPAV